jgi:hypothetical protein
MYKGDSRAIMKLKVAALVLVSVLIISVVFAQLPLSKAGSTVPSIQGMTIEWVVNENSAKKAIVHITTEDGSYRLLVEGQVKQVGPEHYVELDGFLILDNGTEVYASTATAAVFDTLYGAPYAPQGVGVEAIKIHLNAITATVLAVASIIFIAAMFVFAIVEILTATVLSTLLDSLQWIILSASIPWVYLALYGDRNPDSSLTLFIPIDEYIIPILLQGALYLATPYSWWKIQKHTWSWWFLSFDYYSATWVQPFMEMPPISPQSPIASFGWSPDIAFPGEEINFYSTSYDPDGDVQDWHWYFGDGSEATGDNVTHVFTYTGTFDVRLVVTDNDGQVAETSTSLMGVTFNVVPEVPWGTILAFSAMSIAFVAYLTVPRFHRPKRIPK